MIIVLLIIGGLVVAAKMKSNGGASVPFFQKTNYQPWSEQSPSAAGSAGTGETSPLSALMMRFQGALSGIAQPAPFVPLSGPGGATTLPAASAAPAGTTQNTLQASAPGTVPEYALLRADLASASDPQYWWMMPTVDVAIMSDDVNGALAAAGNMDLSQIMIEASIGAQWKV